MAMPTSEYEKRRLANIADNKRVLAALGLLDPLSDKPSLELILDLKKKRKADDSSDKEPPRKKAKSKVLLSDVNIDNCLGSLDVGPVRRSARKQGKIDSGEGKSSSEGLNYLEDENEKPRLKAPPNRENFYGAVAGVEVGAAYDTRLECCVVGIHRPTVAGIHGGPDGAYSIALSGGYEDDIDMGECFTYTGEGGRDLKGTKSNPKNLRTAPQSKDQTLTRGNLALKRNVETGNPVRVIRGYKLKSPYAPEEGYRYDGLYSVEKAWFTTGLSGFGVWKFALKRCENQAPPPWNYVDESSKKSEIEETANAEESSISVPSHIDTKEDQMEDQQKKDSSDSGSTEDGAAIDESQVTEQN